MLTTTPRAGFNVQSRIDVMASSTLLLANVTQQAPTMAGSMSSFLAAAAELRVNVRGPRRFPSAQH